MNETTQQVKRLPAKDKFVLPDGRPVRYEAIECSGWIELFFSWYPADWMNREESQVWEAYLLEPEIVGTYQEAITAYIKNHDAHAQTLL